MKDLGATRPALLLLLLLLAIGCLVARCAGQISRPVARDENAEKDDTNKFLSRKAELDLKPPELHDIKSTRCHQQDGVPSLNIDPKWMTEVSSSIYATPLITDLYADGQKDIVVPSFVHYLEVLEGADGAQAIGWPAFHKSTVHSSPMMYDIDFDGIRDLMVVTFDGEVLFFKDTGEMLKEKLSLERLKVRRDWFVGLNPDATDHSHPDIGDEGLGSRYKDRRPPGRGGVDHTAGLLPRSQKARVAEEGRGGNGGGSDIDGVSGGEAVRAHGLDLTAEVQEQLKVFKEKMLTYRAKFGEQAAHQLLEETHKKNPGFYKIVVADMERANNLLNVQDSPPPPPPPSLATTTQPVAATPGTVTATATGTSTGTAETTTQPVPASTSTTQTVPVPATATNTAATTTQTVPAATITTQTVPAAATTTQAVPAAATTTQAVPATATDTQPVPGATTDGTGSTGSTGRKLMSLSGDVSAGMAQQYGGQYDEQEEEELVSSRRQLMQADDVAGVELGGDPLLSEEASESFEVFENEEEEGEEEEKYGSEGLGGGGDGSDLSTEVGDEYDEGEDKALMDGDERDTAYKVPEIKPRVVVRGDEEGVGEREDYHDASFESEVGGKYGGEDMEKYGDNDEFEYDEFGDKFVKSLDGNFHGDVNELQDDTLDLLDLVPHADMTAEGEGEELNKANYDHLYMGDYAKMATDRELWLEKQQEKMWEEEAFEQTVHGSQTDYVYVDAHVLTNGAIGDIDNDGHEELVLAVSFFYDAEYYDDPEHAKELKGVDMGKYIASGIVALDLRTKKQKWMVHLDLSTDNTTFKAYAYAAPTLIDVNKDGFMEIVVGASMGFLYLLDHKGNAMDGWPVQMGSIEGQALVADINNDGEVEIVAGDSHGNVACFNIAGEEIWSRHVRSSISQGPVAGDVDGDGDLEVVFGTAAGYLFALKGATGEDIPHFPFRTHGRIHAPILITRLKDGPGQHMIFMSFDGFLYLVDGIEGCADSVDVGEMSYSMVLADDLDNNGQLDLVVTTMNGNVYVFETYSDYHPLKAWPSQVMGVNGMVARHDYYGVYATSASRKARDVAGEKLQIQIDIVDKRMVFAPNGSLIHRGGPYNVSVVLKGVGVKEMNAGDQPVIGVADELKEAKTFSVELPCPRTRTTAIVHIELTDAHGLVVIDEFALSFHLHFHKLFKWMVALPLVIMVVMLMAINKQSDDPELPSYNHLG